jgi:hypothetical protein
LAKYRWQSTHDRLYANRDFKRFHVKDREKCTYCSEEKPTIDHMFKNCTRDDNLFAKIYVQFKQSKLTTFEKLESIPGNNETYMEAGKYTPTVYVPE